MRKITVLAALSLLLALSPAFSQTVESPALRSFEFLGCSGEWDGRFTKPQSWRLTGSGQVTFLTRHLATCGLTGRNPVVSGSAAQVDLSYALESDPDAVVMCDCEYWAKFTFGPEASGITSVSVNGDQADLMGKWPGR